MGFEEIDDFISKGSNKLKLEQGNVYKLKFLNAEVVTGQYGKQVSLEFVDLSDGDKKRLYTTSQKLLKKLFQEIKVKPDDLIYIRKTGDRFETVYEVRTAPVEKEKKKRKAKPKEKKEEGVDIQGIKF